MKWTTKILGMAYTVMRSKLGSSMPANVVVGFDVILAHARDDDGNVADVVDVVVADIRNMFETTRPLPGAPPHHLHFLIEEIGAGIAFWRYIDIAEEFIALLCEYSGRWHAVRGEDLLGGRAGASGRSRRWRRNRTHCRRC